MERDRKKFQFPVNLFCSLMLLGFIPFLYTLVRTNLIANIPSTDGLGVAGHIEWFDLINETIQAFLIVPLYALLNGCIGDKDKFRECIFQAFMVVNIVYILFSVIIFMRCSSIVHAMASERMDEVTRYLRIETIGFIYGYTVLFDSILIGCGKTYYCFAISAIVNLVYYPVVYGLFLKGILKPGITFICMMFGFGMVIHLVCSIICFVLYKSHFMKNFFIR